MSTNEAYQIIDDTEEIFNEFGTNASTYPSNMDETKKLEKEIIEDISKILYEPIIFIKIDTYSDEIRTFLFNKIIQ